MHKWISENFTPENFFGFDKNIATTLFLLCCVILIIYLIERIFRFLLKTLFERIKLHNLEQKTQYFNKHNVFRKAERLITPVCFLILLNYVFPENEIGGWLYLITTKIILLYLYVVLWNFLMSFATSIDDLITAKGHKAIRGFTQITQIFISLVILILIISMLLDKSPFNVLAGLGASAAVMMFVFKDTLLGFVASVQLSLNNMLQIGDWISMPKYDADGVVIEIGLTAVKVRNWDNTITNIPTYNLVSDSYQNWRGMSDSGGRRIMRSISIDMQSIKFCTNDMLERFEKISLLKDYIAQKKEEFRIYNASQNIDADVPVNARRLTNIGVFREYLERYLENNPNVILSMTHFVRQRQPTEKGLPLELYFFTTTEWIPYENIQSDIFDHIIAAIPQFDLRIFQDESDAPEQLPQKIGN